ncbi:MAG: class I SAM-dependent methyltransferase [Acidaminococcales bacterium]|jgi:2-polyprenyl-3-methyl-5-hydroxy-6-metoxy-1,4-benzoquinol methylase|nr:class I SAM-dependent methyltransferase [Acidaminococcales bacterium]
MKNDDFDYSYHYGNWHFDTPESQARDIEGARKEFDAHNIYPARKTAKILEIGSGMGRTMLMLRDLGYENMYGIDIDPSQIKVAEKAGLNVCLSDATEFFKENDEKYDAIYAFDVLEHIGKGQQVHLLEGMREHLSQDGFVVLRVPNALFPIASYFRYIDFTHTLSYTSETISFLLHNAGLHFFAVRPQYKESAGLQNLKLPWVRLIRRELGMKDFIMTPNLMIVAFKDENVLKRYLVSAPKIKNDYQDGIKATLRRVWLHIKTMKF